jgi:hypothetical protein
MNNKNFTRYQFSKMLRNALAFTGYSPDEFNTHSLRIGAATQTRKYPKKAIENAQLNKTDS